MNLLAPLFLIGTALVLGPILFHLIKQAPRNRVVFSSTNLLEASEPKTEKSKRIQNPLLLLLRCLIIALLALAYARPFFSSGVQENASKVRRDVVIAIDRSASMQRTGIETNVAKALNELLVDLSEEDNLTVIAFTDTPTVIMSSDQWKDWPLEDPSLTTEKILASTPATALPAQLDKAVRAAIAEGEAMREYGDSSSLVEIHLISDFAQGTSLSGLAGLEWPTETMINRIPVQTTASLPNIGIKWLGWENDGSDRSMARLSISSTDPSISIPIQVQAYDAIDDRAIGEPLQVVLEERSEKIVPYPLEPEFTKIPLRFTLEGDSQPFDNSLYVAPEYIPNLTISVVSDHPPGDSTSTPYFIKAAFDGFLNPAATVEASTDLSGQSDLYFIDKPLSSETSVRLRSYIKTGAIAVVLISSDQFSETIEYTSNSTDWRLQPAEESGLLIGEVDFTHTLFSPFADTRFSNFANIRTWNPMHLEYPTSDYNNVLARFDDGYPLLVELEIGEGKLYLWSSPWAPKASQWVLSSKFIPFLHRLALLATGGPALKSNVILSTSNLVDYASEIPQDFTTQNGSIQASNDRWFAFQIDPEESQTTPISIDTWDRLGMPNLDEAQQLRRIERIELSKLRESEVAMEQRQQVWKWLLWLVLILLGIESLLAISRNRKQEVIAS